MSTIKVDDPDGNLEKLFSEEEGDRSSVSIRKEGTKLTFRIEATDSVALRATLNSITKLLTVYENMSGD